MDIRYFWNLKGWMTTPFIQTASPRHCQKRFSLPTSRPFRVWRRRWCFSRDMQLSMTLLIRKSWNAAWRHDASPGFSLQGRSMAPPVMKRPQRKDFSQAWMPPSVQGAAILLSYNERKLILASWSMTWLLAASANLIVCLHHVRSSVCHCVLITPISGWRLWLINWAFLAMIAAKSLQRVRMHCRPRVWWPKSWLSRQIRPADMTFISIRMGYVALPMICCLIRISICRSFRLSGQNWILLIQPLKKRWKLKRSTRFIWTASRAI